MELYLIEVLCTVVLMNIAYFYVQCNCFDLAIVKFCSSQHFKGTVEIPYKHVTLELRCSNFAVGLPHGCCKVAGKLQGDFRNYAATLLGGN